jgi:hypothetical protein
MFTEPHISTQRDSGRQRGLFAGAGRLRRATRFGGRLRGSPAPAWAGGRMLKRAAVGTAAAVLCLSAGAGAAQAQVTAPSAAHSASMSRVLRLGHGLPPVTTVNLHREYLAQLRHVKLGKIGGIVRPRDWHAPRAANANTASCTEPNCDVTYHGGSVQHNPQVFLVLWGPDWSTQSGEEATSQYLGSFYAGLGIQGAPTGPGDTWSPITAQYSDGSGFPAFTTRVLAAVGGDTSTPPTGATPTQLAAEADTWAAYFASQGFTINTNSQIVVATQSGTCPLNFGGAVIGCPTPAPGQAYCAWHSAFSGGSFSDVPFTNLPYLLDAGTLCGENFVNSGSAGTDDGFSMIGGHEYAESITDPVPDSGWIDTGDSISGGEIADKCVWGGHNWGGSDPYGDVTLFTGSFAMQSLWSNAAGACVMADATEDAVTVNDPGTQHTGTTGTVSLQMTGSSSGSNPLQWIAYNLPTGLSINSSTGLITGTATGDGTITTSVAASDDTGATYGVSFAWNVVPDTVTVTNPGNQTSYAQAAISVPLSGSSSAGFTPLTWGGTFPAGAYISSTGRTTASVVGAPYNPGTWTVTPTATDTGNITGSTSFSLTVKPDVGKQLKESSAKRCLNDNKSLATVGNAVNVWSCKALGSIVGLGAQDWSLSTSTGQLKVFGLCLSDPKSGGTGTKLALAKCTSTTSDHWTYKSNGEYVLKLNGLCLTDPKASTKDGTQVTITGCQDTTAQKWTKP